MDLSKGKNIATNLQESTSSEIHKPSKGALRNPNKASRLVRCEQQISKVQEFDS